MNRITYCGWAKHIKHWKLFPWIATGSNGWEFTWLFFALGSIDATEDELDEFIDD